MTIFPDGFRPEAALIDMDGTLYDSMPNHSRAWMTMCGEQLAHFHQVLDQLF